jgi:hypothetical protein
MVGENTERNQAVDAGRCERQGMIFMGPIAACIWRYCVERGRPAAADQWQPPSHFTRRSKAKANRADPSAVAPGVRHVCVFCGSTQRSPAYASRRLRKRSALLHARETTSTTGALLCSRTHA